MTFRTLGHRRLIAVIGAAVVAAIAAAVASGIFTGNASGAKGSNQQHADRYKHSFDNRLPAGEEHGRDRQRYTIGLFGDMPYGALGRSQYPNLLADINHHRVAFSIFDGDLQAGGDGPCNDSLYSTAIGKLQHPPAAACLGAG